EEVERQADGGDERFSLVGRPQHARYPVEAEHGYERHDRVEPQSQWLDLAPHDEQGEGHEDQQVRRSGQAGDVEEQPRASYGESDRDVQEPGQRGRVHTEPVRAGDDRWRVTYHGLGTT